MSHAILGILLESVFIGSILKSLGLRRGITLYGIYTFIGAVLGALALVLGVLCNAFEFDSEVVFLSFYITHVTYLSLSVIDLKGIPLDMQPD